MPESGPETVHTLEDLARELRRLRRQAARPGQVQLSIRDLAARVRRAPSTLEPYLNGKRLCPADVYEDILRALGVERLRPWLDAWERVAEGGGPPVVRERPDGRRRLLPHSRTLRYETQRGGTVGVVAGDLRRVTGIDAWVNSENTEMRMSRFEEYSVSAVIRFEGAVRDASGAVVDDLVADELERAVSGRRPVPAGTAITTGAGRLTATNGVRHVIHVAAVRGEPGQGYRPVADVGRCVTNALAEAERLAAAGPVRSILFPLLGVGVAGGALGPTVDAMLGAIMHHLGAPRRPGVSAVHLLASTAEEFDACRRALVATPGLTSGDEGTG
ncbi:helix-turn-helix domain-containing protein [Dactylosporangium sp. CA-233914]|uniref:helix-turn-helix domain-containing protein n=1 Tax=Dactylosporangium sp. CA-233914 TaxID=3239934 RepID=UPI003D8C6143